MEKRLKRTGGCRTRTRLAHIIVAGLGTSRLDRVAAPPLKSKIIQCACVVATESEATTKTNINRVQTAALVWYGGSVAPAKGKFFFLCFIRLFAALLLYGRVYCQFVATVLLDTNVNNQKINEWAANWVS